MNIDETIQKLYSEFDDKFSLLLLDTAIQKGYQIKNPTTGKMFDGFKILLGGKTYYFHNQYDISNSFILFTVKEKSTFDPKSDPSKYTFHIGLSYSTEISEEELEYITNTYERYKEIRKFCRYNQNLQFRRVGKPETEDY